MEPAEKPAVIKASIPISKPVVILRMDVDFDHQTDEVQFYYQDENGEFEPLGHKMKLYFKLDHFTGCRAGLFVFSTKESGGEASFHSIEATI